MQTWNYKRYLASDSPSAAFGRTQITLRKNHPNYTKISIIQIRVNLWNSWFTLVVRNLRQ